MVNKGSIIINGQSFSKPYYCVFTYPVAREMEVMCGDITFLFRKGEVKRTCESLGPGESLGSTVRFYPSNEDDTYIYEVTINV